MVEVTCQEPSSIFFSIVEQCNVEFLVIVWMNFWFALTFDIKYFEVTLAAKWISPGRQPSCIEQESLYRKSSWMFPLYTTLSVPGCSLSSWNLRLVARVTYKGIEKTPLCLGCSCLKGISLSSHSETQTGIFEWRRGYGGYKVALGSSSGGQVQEHLLAD